MSKEKIQIPKPSSEPPTSKPGIPLTPPKQGQINKGSVPQMIDPPPPPPRPVPKKG